MNNLERRIERLEETLGIKPGPREIILTNVDFSDGTEAPIFPGVWANVYGGPLTSEEIDKLREEYAEESDGVPGDA
jgi:hypothetical protein